MIDITESLNSIEQIKNTYDLFENKIKNLSYNPAITRKAKEIANNCFDELLHYLNDHRNA